MFFFSYRGMPKDLLPKQVLKEILLGARCCRSWVEDEEQRVFVVGVLTDIGL